MRLTNTNCVDHDAQLGQLGWEFLNEAEGASLRWRGAPTEVPLQGSLRQALEREFSHDDALASIKVVTPPSEVLNVTGFAGIAQNQSDSDVGAVVVHRDMFFQHPELWIDPATSVQLPLRYVLTRGSRHPLRPSKPTGEVYRRYIPWLQMTVSFRVVTIDEDLATFHRWMNDPVVAHFWEEEGDLTQHHSYLQRIAEDEHTIGLIGCFNDEPFGYFEVYWAKEDRIAPFYDAADYDRGWHVLVGEDKYRGKPYLTAWMPSVAHYIFLADCRTQRIVIEPRADNEKMIKNLARCGYALLKEFDFPHKRAMLGMLSRERFFSEAFWLPRG